MRFGKKSSRVVVALVVAGLLAAGWFAFIKSDQKNPSPATQTNQPANAQTGQTSQPNAGSQTTTSPTGTFVEKTNYKYEVPSGWVELKKEALDQAGADSGIGRVSALAATFRTRLSTSTPKDETELKNSTLDDVKRNAPNFTLMSSVSTKVDNQSGQVFIYTFSDTASQQKFRHQLSAVPYKGKTFFLLASSIDSDFDKQTAEFKKILDSFKFK